MQPQQAPLIFTEAERPLGERLLKLALETDRVEGYTEPHAVMIARLAETIGAQLGLHGTDLSALKFAALAHDIGEREMKRNYLLQPNELTWEQILDLWRHPIIGEQAAAELQLPRQTQLLIRWHHEWWNGQGYPDGMTGEAIPLGARILRAVDTYCALISRRPHRGNYDLLDAEQIVADQAGIELDPQIVKLLLALVIAERKQREAESRPVEMVATPITDPEAEDVAEPQFELRRARAAEEEFVNSPAAEFEAKADVPTPAHSPEADTLEMAPVLVKTPAPEILPEHLPERLPEYLVTSPDLPPVEFQPAENQFLSEDLAVSETPIANTEPDAPAVETSAAEPIPATDDHPVSAEPTSTERPRPASEVNESEPALHLEPEADREHPPTPPMPNTER
jgi:hypothetical protein